MAERYLAMAPSNFSSISLVVGSVDQENKKKMQTYGMVNKRCAGGMNERKSTHAAGTLSAINVPAREVAKCYLHKC